MMKAGIMRSFLHFWQVMAIIAAIGGAEEIMINNAFKVSGSRLVFIFAMKMNPHREDSKAITIPVRSDFLKTSYENVNLGFLPDCDMAW